MSHGLPTSLDTCPPGRVPACAEASACEARPGLLVRCYRKTRNHLRGLWRMGWLKRSGPTGFGRLAARLASWDTMPYQGRAFLADLTPHGFIAGSAGVSHPDVRLGASVYIGDRTMISRGSESGPVRFGDRVQIYGNTFIDTGAGASIEFGESTHVQPGCHFHAQVSDIVIGRSVEIAAGCALYSYDHGMEPGRPIMEQPLQSKGPIHIGDGVWLGHGVTVLQGVSIGAGAIVAAGSVVVRDIPENAIAAGVPARVIRFRDGTKPQS